MAPRLSYYPGMIVHIGEALIDFIPVTDDEGAAAYRPSPGGSPYNSSIASARLRVPAAYLGRISRDFFGDQILDRLTANGVNAGLVVRTTDPSTLAFVKKTESGEARYGFFSNGAADRGLLDEHLPDMDTGVDGGATALVFGSISLIADPTGSTILKLVEREVSRRVVSFDPNIRESLVVDPADYHERVRRGIAASTIVKVSDEDLAWITEEADLEAAARSLLSMGPSLIAVTRGDAGAFALTEKTVVRVDAVKTAVSDTIGAGDSFHAAILAWLYHKDRLTRSRVEALGEDELRSLLEFAAAVAARTCSRPGADPPTLDEVSLR
jgi:fructokinase